MNLAITALCSRCVFYGPFGVGGIVAATAIATAASVVAQSEILRRQLGRLELGRLAWTTAAGRRSPRRRSPRPATAIWRLLDEALGRGLAGQIVSLGVALGARRRRLRGGDHAAADSRGGADLAPRSARTG